MIEKQLPHNIEAEQAILGSILYNPNIITRIAGILTPDHFYRDAHRTIYRVMLALDAKHVPVEETFLIEELERLEKFDEVGGYGYFAHLLNSAPLTPNIEHYAQLIEKKARLRSAIQLSGKIAAMGYEEDENTVSFAQEQFFQIGQGRTGNPVVDHVSALDRYWDHLNALHEQNSKGVLTGIPTGYKLLNEKLGGWRASKLYILAARPGEGKTALALNFAYEAIRKGFQVLFFSIEMDEGELMQRMVAIESKVDSLHLRDARFEDTEWEHVVNGITRLQQLPGKLWTDDTPANDIDAMRAKAREALATHGVDLIIVDYLQLAESGKSTDNRAENRRVEVEKVSRKLKEMARELKVPVLSLAQLNRNVEGRAGHRPQLSDLREAGGIEQDGDVVMFIHRDPDEKESKKDETDYNVSLLIEKHRNGPKGEIRLRFVGSETRFYPLEDPKKERR